MGQVRASVATLRGLYEALTYLMPDEDRVPKEIAALFGAAQAVARARFEVPVRFDVIYRLPAYGVFDRLQQMAPRAIAGSLTWVAEQATRLEEQVECRFAATIDLPLVEDHMKNRRALVVLLEGACRDLRRGDCKPLAPGQSPTLYTLE